MVLPFLPPHPGHHGWHQIPGGLLPQPASCYCGRWQKGRERGALRGPRSRGRAGCVAIPPSASSALGDPMRRISAAWALPLPAGRPWFVRLIRVHFPLLRNGSGGGCQCWDWGRWNERLRPDRAEGTTGASRPTTVPFSNPATRRRAQARAGSKMRTKPARI